MDPFAQNVGSADDFLEARAEVGRLKKLLLASRDSMRSMKHLYEKKIHELEHRLAQKANDHDMLVSTCSSVTAIVSVRT